MSTASAMIGKQTRDRPASQNNPGTQFKLRDLRKQIILAACWSFALAAYFYLADRLCQSVCQEAGARLALLAGQMAVLVGFGFVAYRIVHSNRVYILTPAFAFVCCLIVFFGFGGLSTLFLADETALFVARGAYHLEADDQLRTNALTFSGAGVLFLSMALVIGPALKLPRERAPLPLRRAAISITVAGLLVKYFIIVPSLWGYTSWVVPGAITSAAQLPDIGFLLMAFAIMRGDRAMKSVFLILWIPHTFLCLLDFSKTSLMFALILPAIGYFLGGGLRRAAALFVASAILFAVVQNPILAARQDILSHSGTENHAPLEKRAAILVDSFEALTDDRAHSRDAYLPPQLWWARLNYAGPQLQAMHMYDRGTEMDWLVSPLAYAIPRAIWPEKPILVNPGLLFNRMVTGNSDTSGRVAITIFGEGYWFMGWAGAWFFSMVTGVILGLISRQSIAKIVNRDFLFLPLILFGFKLGAVDVLGFLQTNVLGGFSVYIGTALALTVFTALLRRLRV